MKKQIASYLIGLTVFSLVFVVTLGLVALAGSVTGFGPPLMPKTGIMLFAATSIAVPGVLAFFSARLSTRTFLKKFHVNPIRLPRVLLVLILAGYLVTGVFGSPAAQSSNSMRAVEEFKRLKADKDVRVWSSHPYISTYATLPILPFVVMSYHEYQLSGLYGWGGWDVQLWYVAGVKRLFSLPMWIS